ncbi:MAG: DUF3857 and transglutaminase domain-containing protein [Opitutaceae bacterium]|jgi:hypothetical protein|nr:DUF3857 and transglutaminase domain-containing protein [Opitutaceae bacterium]
MTSKPNPCIFNPCISAFLIAVVLTPAARALDWIRVSAEDRAATESKTDPEAGAEILYRVAQYDNSTLGDGQIEEYVRIKVFNEKGVRRVAKMEVFCEKYEYMHSMEARVIKPDGTIIKVGRKSFFDRMAIKFGDTSVQMRAFSFPQLAPGDIAEYKWVKVSYGGIGGRKLRLQMDLPTRHVIFRLKPRPTFPGERTVAFAHGCPEQKTKLSGDGYTCLEMRDVPAYVIEANMPPPDDMQPWILFYTTDWPGNPEGFWKWIGTEAASKAERHAKNPSKTVREKAASLTGDVTETAEKLARLNDYCRQSILNVSYFAPTGGADRKKLMQDFRSPDELMTSGFGNWRDIPVLFMAMARALGLDARLVLAANWTHGVFRKGIRSRHYLPNHLVAVKEGEGWKFYDPAHSHVSTGSLYWMNEGNRALITSPKAVEWVTLPVTPADRSLQKRTARLRLDEEGTLTGRVAFEYSGHSETDARRDFYKLEPAKAMDLLRKREKQRNPACVVSRLRVDNSDDFSKPVKVSYDVEIPGYAEKAGDRLFIQPAFFEKGVENMFPEKKRVNDIFFKYNKATEDDVTIKIPDGYQLEEASAPSSAGEANWGRYKVTLAFKKNAGEIICKREFAFNQRSLSAEGYKVVKRIFDYVHAQDAHILTLKAGAGE